MTVFMKMSGFMLRGEINYTIARNSYVNFEWKSTQLDEVEYTDVSL